jgi:hypothetical protein
MAGAPVQAGACGQRRGLKRNQLASDLGEQRRPRGHELGAREPAMGKRGRRYSTSVTPSRYSTPSSGGSAALAGSTMPWVPPLIPALWSSSGAKANR